MAKEMTLLMVADGEKGALFVPGFCSATIAHQGHALDAVRVRDNCFGRLRRVVRFRRAHSEDHAWCRAIESRGNVPIAVM